MEFRFEVTFRNEVEEKFVYAETEEKAIEKLESECVDWCDDGETFTYELMESK